MIFKRCISTALVILLMSANAPIVFISAYADYMAGIKPVNNSYFYQPEIGESYIINMQEVQDNHQEISSEALPLKFNKQAYSYDQMNKDIDRLIEAYPDKIQKKVIGKSVLGRDIPAVILGDPKASKKIIVIGSVHGREYMGTQLIMRQIQYYLLYPREKYKGVCIETQLNRVCIHFIPMLNPDGVMLSEMGLSSIKDQDMKKKLLKLNKGSSDFKEWKANIRGVDLNRNFNTKWRSISYMPRGPEFYKGPYPVSEPETHAIADYIAGMNFNAVLTYHSSGQIIYWYFFQKGNAYKRDYKIAASIAYTTGYKLVPKDSRVSNGGLKDWFVQNYGRPGFTIEVGTGKSPLPLWQFNNIWNRNRYIPLLISQQIK